MCMILEQLMRGEEEAWPPPPEGTFAKKEFIHSTLWWLIALHLASPWPKSQTLPFLTLCLDRNAFSYHSALLLTSLLPSTLCISPAASWHLHQFRSSEDIPPVLYPNIFLAIFSLCYILIYSLGRNLTFLCNSRKSSAVGSIMGKQRKRADGRRVSPGHWGKALLKTLTEEKVFNVIVSVLLQGEGIKNIQKPFLLRALLFFKRLSRLYKFLLLCLYLFFTSAFSQLPS